MPYLPKPPKCSYHKQPHIKCLQLRVIVAAMANAGPLMREEEQSGSELRAAKCKAVAANTAEQRNRY